MVFISPRYMLSPCFMRWSMLEWMLMSCRRRIKELLCRQICRLVPSLMVRNLFGEAMDICHLLGEKVEGDCAMPY